MCGAGRGGGVLERHGKLEGDGRGAEIQARIGADRWMHDRRLGQHPVGAGCVVVGDHDLHPELERASDLIDGGDRAVHRHEQARAPRGEPLDRQ